MGFFIQNNNGILAPISVLLFYCTSDSRGKSFGVDLFLKLGDPTSNRDGLCQTGLVPKILSDKGTLNWKGGLYQDLLNDWNGNRIFRHLRLRNANIDLWLEKLEDGKYGMGTTKSACLSFIFWNIPSRCRGLEQYITYIPVMEQLYLMTGIREGMIKNDSYDDISHSVSGFCISEVLESKTYDMQETISFLDWVCMQR